MLRTAVTGLVVTLVAGVVVASGSSLIIANDPILQSFLFDVEYEPATDVDLYVEVREYAGGSGILKDSRRLGPYTIPAGQDYYVGYDKDTRTCPETMSHQQTGGPFTPSEGLTHVLCVQHGQKGTVTVRTNGADGGVVTPDGEVPGALVTPPEGELPIDGQSTPDANLGKRNDGAGSVIEEAHEDEATKGDTPHQPLELGEDVTDSESGDVPEETPEPGDGEEKAAGSGDEPVVTSELGDGPTTTSGSGVSGQVTEDFGDESGSFAPDAP